MPFQGHPFKTFKTTQINNVEAPIYNASKTKCHTRDLQDLLPSLYPKHFGGRSTVAWAEQKEDYSHV
jgi:hypothetical protein